METGKITAGTSFYIRELEKAKWQMAKFEQRLAAAEAKIPGWIPVSERLPKQNGDYLVSTEHFVAEAEFDACIGEFQEFSINGWAEVKGVTAWQELPEVYTPKCQVKEGGSHG